MVSARFCHANITLVSRWRFWWKLSLVYVIATCCFFLEHAFKKRKEKKRAFSGKAKRGKSGRFVMCYSFGFVWSLPFFVFSWQQSRLSPHHSPAFVRRGEEPFLFTKQTVTLQQFWKKGTGEKKSQQTMEPCFVHSLQIASSVTSHMSRSCSPKLSDLCHVDSNRLHAGHFAIDQPLVCIKLFFHIFFSIASSINTWKALTYSVHAGLFECFHNPPNSDMDHRIFNVRMCSCSMREHMGDLGFIVTCEGLL